MTEGMPFPKNETRYCLMTPHQSQAPSSVKALLPSPHAAGVPREDPVFCVPFGHPDKQSLIGGAVPHHHIHKDPNPFPAWGHGVESLVWFGLCEAVYHRNGVPVHKSMVTEDGRSPAGTGRVSAMIFGRSPKSASVLRRRQAGVFFEQHGKIRRLVDADPFCDLVGQKVRGL